LTEDQSIYTIDATVNAPLQFGKPFNLLERRRVQIIDQGFSPDF